MNSSISGLILLLLVCNVFVFFGCGKDDEPNGNAPPPAPEDSGKIVAITEQITGRLNDLLQIAVYPPNVDWYPGYPDTPYVSILKVINSDDFSIYQLMQEPGLNNQDTGIPKWFPPADYSVVFFTITPPTNPPDHFTEVRLHVNGLDSLDNTDWYQTVADLYWTYWDNVYSGVEDLSSYLDYEYWVATQFGYDGDSSTHTDNYAGDITSWQDSLWTAKQMWLPDGGFPDELDPTNPDETYYDWIRKDQFGAGWLSSGDIPSDYRQNPTTFGDWVWMATNTYRETYKSLYAGCDLALAPSWGTWTGN